MRVQLDTTALNWLTDNTELAEECLRAWQAGRVEVMVTPVFDLEGINEAPFNGWVWKLSASTPVPPGLKLVQDKPHHYSIASRRKG